MILKGLNLSEVLGVLEGTTIWLVSHKRPNRQGFFDGGNHVLNRLGDHSLERSRGDVVERERGRIRATASIVIRSPLIQ